MSEPENKAPAWLDASKVLLGLAFLIGTGVGGGAGSALSGGAESSATAAKVDLLASQVAELIDESKEIRAEFAEAGSDRWRRSQHDAYEAEEDREDAAALANLEARLRREFDERLARLEAAGAKSDGEVAKALRELTTKVDDVRQAVAVLQAKRGDR